MEFLATLGPESCSYFIIFEKSHKITLHRFVIIAILMCAAIGARSQIDKEFWFAVPEATSAHGDDPIFLRLSALDDDAYVVIDMPAYNSFNPIRLTIKANTSRNIELTKYKGLLECDRSNRVENKGLRIRATNFITGYYEIANYWNTEIFSLKGRNALGKQFITPFQNSYGIGTYSPDAYSSIDIVATEDNTIVTIEPSQSLTSVGKQTVTVKLNRGQTYSVTAAGKSGSQHLMGSIVSSSKPVAITIKDDSVVGSPCLDMVGDQLVPVEIVGSEYIIRKGKLTADEFFYLLATEDGTSIKINSKNGTSSRTLNKAQSISWKMVGPAYYITSDKPIYVFHLSGFGCELGGAVIPPLTCTGAKRVSFVRSSSESLFLNIVVRKGDEDEFVFNGNSNYVKAGDFQTVPGTNDWKVAQLEIDQNDLGAGKLGTLINKKSRFQLGVINGGVRSGTKYGYFSPFSSLNLGDSVNMCRGASTILDAGYGFDTILWNTNSKNSKITVNKPGVYSVRVATTNGCVLHDSVEVFIPPKPEISVNDSTQCLENNSFRFEAQNFLSTSTYTWRFQNQQKQGKNFDVSFQKAGKDQVWLISKNDRGCKDSSSVNLEAFEMPVAAFVTSRPKACQGVEIAFSEQSSSGSGYRFNWDFGDGDTSQNSDPKHRYLNTGTYKVTFKVEDPKGCKDLISRQLEVVANPVASFGLQMNSKCENENVTQFTNTSSSTSNFSSVWNFGDQTIGVKQSPKHSYRAGTYRVQLLVQNQDGCQDTAYKWLNILPSPEADFSINKDKQCADVNEFIYRQQSSIDSGSVVSHKWLLGDGSSATGDSIVKVYKNVLNQIDVILISTSADGCIDSATKSVEIYPVPKSAFTVNKTEDCLSGNYFSFFNQSSIANGNLKFQWTFGDGSGASWQHTARQFTSSDTFTVTLVAYDHCYDTSSQQIIVHPQPESAFEVNDSDQCLQGNTFRFANQTRIDHGTLKYDWQLGDGSKISSISPTHKYATWGNYKVRLLATSNQGCKDSHFIYMHVRPEPLADFSINDSTQCFNEQLFQYSDQSSIDSGTWYSIWDFGDSKGGIGSSQRHKYLDTGHYIVTLTAVTPYGCVDSNTSVNEVLPNPEASFIVNDFDQCMNTNDFVFTNKSTIKKGDMAYLWSFGDGELTRNRSTSHSYQYADTFQVTLLVESAMGCQHGDTAQIIVWEKPDIRFYVNDTQQCLENNYLITYNQSTAFQESIRYIWNLGDGTLSIDKAPEHEFKTAGIFTVQLTGVTNTGCTDSMTRNITIHAQPAPNAGFDLESDSAQCLKNNHFELSNKSSIKTGKLKLIWKPDDGRSIEDSTLNLTYSFADTFSFRLIAESAFGCKDSMERSLYVWPQPELSLRYSHPICESDTFLIGNTSKIKWGTANYELRLTDDSKSPGDTFHFIKNWGNYANVITGISNYGCSDTLTDSFLVNPKVKSGFKIDYHYHKTLSLRNQSTIDRGTFSSKIEWGDGIVDSLGHYTHQYQHRGPYYLSLVNTSDSDCVSLAAQEIKHWKNHPSLKVVSRMFDTLDSGISVTWHTDERAFQYALLRKAPEEMAFSLVDSNFNGLGYEDFDATIDTLIYEYALLGKDSLGRWSDTSVPGRNIVLKNAYFRNDESALISWTPYGDHWKKTDTHIVFRWDRERVRIGYTKGGILSFSDSSSNQIANYCYRIAALGPDKEISYSNVLCNENLFFVPNAFSPNDDGINDEFRYVINGIRNFEISIYARNGQRVFYSNDPRTSWNGQKEGEVLPIGLYRWVITGYSKSHSEKPRVFSGDVYIVR